MAEQTKALAVVGGPLGGTLEEKVRAFQQMGAAAAQGLFPNGYDTPNKVISAAWQADALGMHPGRYMAGVDVASHGNKLLKFPKWEFEHGILLERLPGYRMKIHQQDAKGADIELFAEGRDSQRVKLTIEDATRRGWAAKDGWLANVDDHLFAKAFHRAAKRLAADVLMGVVPSSDEPREIDVEIVETVATAPAVEGVRVAERSGAVIVDEDATDPRTLLSAEIQRIYGPGQDVATRLEKMALLLAAALREEGLESPEFVFKRLSDIGPVDAERILGFIAKKWPVGATAATATQAAGTSPEATKTASPDPPRSEVRAASEQGEPPADDAAPPAEQAGPAAQEEAAGKDAPPAPQQPESNGPMSWTEFAAVVKQARATFKARRDFIMEAPAKSGRWWFVDKPILDVRGAPGSVCLYRDGQVVEPLEWWADRLRELLVKP